MGCLLKLCKKKKNTPPFTKLDNLDKDEEQKNGKIKER